MTKLPEPTNGLNAFRRQVGEFMEFPLMTGFSTMVIIFNAITLGYHAGP